MPDGLRRLVGLNAAQLERSLRPLGCYGAGTKHYDADNSGGAAARAADGSTIGIVEDATGFGENLFGAGCAFNGAAIAGP